MEDLKKTVLENKNQDTKCQAECEVYSRVVGYLRPIKQWNKGKREEFRQRKTFKLEV